MKGLQLVKNLMAIAIGAAIMGFGINEFNIANNLVSGGVTGIAILLRLALGVDPGLTTLLINLPLLLLGWKLLGGRSMLFAIYGSACFSTALWLFGSFRLPLEDPLLAALFAGAFVGSGAGIILRSGGTTGGADIIARLVQKYFGWKMGRTMFAVDILVISISLIHLNIQQAMYTIVAVFISSRVVDLVQDAAYSMKSAFVVSTESELISKRIMTEMHRGVTMLHGAGAYTGKERDVLYVVVSRSEIMRLKNLILEIDERAFVTITDSSDVMGEGFTWKAI